MSRTLIEHSKPEPEIDSTADDFESVVSCDISRSLNSDFNHHSIFVRTKLKRHHLRTLFDVRII